MLKILRLRPFTVHDLQYVVLIKPFEDAKLVYEVERKRASEIELVAAICNDNSMINEHFSHILMRASSRETPSSLYAHLHKRDETIPTLMVCSQRHGQLTRIQGIKNYHELQALLGLAVNRGYVKDAKGLL